MEISCTLFIGGFSGDDDKNVCQVSWEVCGMELFINLTHDCFLTEHVTDHGTKYGGKLESARQIFHKRSSDD